MVLERHLDNSNYDYDSLTHSTKQKEKIKYDLTSLTKVGEETQIDLNDVSIIDTENIMLIMIIIDRIIGLFMVIKKGSRQYRRSPYIYPSYKDACMNNGITYGRTNNAMPPVTSE